MGTKFNSNQLNSISKDEDDDEQLKKKAKNGPKKGHLTANNDSFPQQPTTNSFFQNIKFVIVMCC